MNKVKRETGKRPVRSRHCIRLGMLTTTTVKSREGSTIPLRRESGDLPICLHSPSRKGREHANCCYGSRRLLFYRSNRM